MFTIWSLCRKNVLFAMNGYTKATVLLPVPYVRIRPFSQDFRPPLQQGHQPSVQHDGSFSLGPPQ